MIFTTLKDVTIDLEYTTNIYQSTKFEQKHAILYTASNMNNSV